MRKSLLLLPLLAVIACGDKDDDTFTGDADCNDEAADVYPGADELCDGVDNDCDGATDEGTGFGTVYYLDVDLDGFAGEGTTVTACAAPEGYYETPDDCDDLDPNAFPGGTEVCDDADNDCDGLIDSDDDDVDTTTGGTYYLDADGDGYGLDDSTTESCGTPDGYADQGGDCDDTNAELHPETLWYSDADGDGYGSDFYTTESCTQPSGYGAVPGDCDDTRADVNPDAQEICDGNVDNDCDGDADDADASVDTSGFQDWYTDSDGDGYGDVDATPVNQCNGPSGTINDGSDCDDTSTDVNPGMEEVCNDGVDNDCSDDASECGVPTGTAYAADVFSQSFAGPNSSDYMRQVALGDFDGDGTNDMAFGSYGNDENSTTAGAVYVGYGPISGGMDGLAATVYGENYYDGMGYSMDAGDFNGDGYDDIIAGGYLGSNYYGRAHVIYGSATALSGDYDASDANTVTIEGEHYYDYFGYYAGSIGDVNGDGYDELVISEYNYDDYQTNGGAVYFWWGSTTAVGTDASDADFVVLGEYYEYLGWNQGIEGGDLNGDGYNEIMLGAYSTSSDCDGCVYLAYGASSATASGTYYSGDFDARISAEENNSGFGGKIHSDDLNGDGYDDVVVGHYDASYNANSYEGTAYLVYGSTTTISGDYDIGNLGPAQFGGEAQYDDFGYDIASGDLNNDGDNDLVITARYADDGSNYSTGAVYVFFGPVTGGSAADADAKILGKDSYSYCGYFGTKVGDVTDDGVDDLLFSCYGQNSYGGAYYLIEGGAI